ncbi:MAG: hypothetical protein BGO49_12030 [Planctomycetales bacterium 71-10]|nr:MAG: hypothetical protein BGO49_12030 [Planctomycetales bacterium 71-10]
MSIVDTIKNQLSGEVLAKLSSILGESEEKTSATVGAAVPAILSTLANSVLSGKGLDGLLDALRGVEGTDPVDTLRSSNSDGPPPGGDILGSLLGPNLSTLINILSKFSGVGLPALKTLLSYVGPIILSAIAAQLKGKGGLTPANLTSFFTAEKANITRALPASLSLADLPSIPGVPTSVPVGKAPTAGIPPWLLPALALGFLALAAFYFMSGPQEAPAPPPPVEAPAAPATAIPPAPTGDSLTIPTADEVSKGLSEIYSGATQTLADVKDAATAEAAAPKLQGLDDRLSTLKGLWDKLPAEARSTIAKVTVEHLDTLKALVGKVLEIPGVGEKLKPILDALLAKLAEFAA